MIVVKRHSNMWCSSCGNKTDNNEVLIRYTDESGRTTNAGGSLVSLCDKCALELVGRLSAALYKESEEVITRGSCMICGKELTEGLFFCKECEAKIAQGASIMPRRIKPHTEYKYEEEK